MTEPILFGLVAGLCAFAFLVSTWSKGEPAITPIDAPMCPPHKFEPRYDDTAPNLAILDKIAEHDSLAEYDVSELLNDTRTKTYVRDVCPRCGNTIERMK